MRNASKPAARSFANSAAVRMPDSLTAMQSIGNLFNQFERSFNAHIKCFEIAIVDADNFCSCSDGAPKFLAGVNLDYRLHAEFPAERD